MADINYKLVTEEAAEELSSRLLVRIQKHQSVTTEALELAQAAETAAAAAQTAAEAAQTTSEATSELSEETRKATCVAQSAADNALRTATMAQTTAVAAQVTADAALKASKKAHKAADEAKELAQTKQDALTAGENIRISEDSVISASVPTLTVEEVDVWELWGEQEDGEGPGDAAGEEEKDLD